MKSNSKFKVGDRVVVAKFKEDSVTDLHYRLGQAVTVGGIIENIRSGKLIVPIPDKQRCAIYEDELELENIYNSPLYKALT